MATRRGRLAWFMLLTLVLILGLSCFAFARAHDCANEGACPVCLFLKGSVKLAALALLVLSGAITVLHFQLDVSEAILPSLSLITRKIRMNN